MPERSQLPAALIAAYTAARYVVHDDDSAFVLSIGAASRELQELYRRYDVHSAAFITAYNPYGKVVSAAANTLKQRELESKLASYVVLRGSGEDPARLWPGEPSVLALGISVAEASDLGSRLNKMKSLSQAVTAYRACGCSASLDGLVNTSA